MNRFLLPLLALGLLAACSPAVPEAGVDAGIDVATLDFAYAEVTAATDAIPPKSSVKLMAGDRVLSEQTCDGVPTSTLIDGAVLAARCWWAGGGQDFAVFDADGTLMLRTRWVDEETGEGAWDAGVELK